MKQIQVNNDFLLANITFLTICMQISAKLNKKKHFEFSTPFECS